MQEFKFNVTGTERKKLAGAISEILNTPIKYLGAPTFAYEVGNYHIDKNGLVTGEHDLNLFVGLAGRGFEPEQSRTFHLITPRGTLLIRDHFETAEEARAAGYGLYFDHETDGIWRQVWSKSDENHHTEFAVVGAPFAEAPATEEISANEEPEAPAVEESAADTAPEITRLVIEYPLDGFTPEAIENLTKMVLAKEALLKKVLGTEELPIQIPDDQCIAFPWFSIETDSDTATAYTQFIAALCKTAKEKKRVTAKAPEAFENEKFAILENRVCYGGLDLSSTTDITAFVLVFPPEDEEDKYIVLPFFWIPDECLETRVRRDHVPYDMWKVQGFLNTTEGDVIHYSFVEKHIEELGKKYNIKEITFDRWGAWEMTQNLESTGFTVVPFGQGFKDMSPATKELMRLVLERKIAHAGNPPLRWMADNLYVSTDAAGNIKPNKQKATERIDGAVALIMALDRAIRGENQGAYDERGMLIIDPNHPDGYYYSK